MNYKTGSDLKPVIAKIQIKWTYTKKATGSISFNLRILTGKKHATIELKRLRKI